MSDYDYRVVWESGKGYRAQFFSPGLKPRWLDLGTPSRETHPEASLDCKLDQNITGVPGTVDPVVRRPEDE